MLRPDIEAIDNGNTDNVGDKKNSTSLLPKGSLPKCAPLRPTSSYQGVERDVLEQLKILGLLCFYP
jgi:hypothetical protein